MTVFANPVQQDFADAIKKLNEAIDELRTGIEDVATGNEAAATSMQKPAAVQKIEDALRFLETRT